MIHAWDQLGYYVVPVVLAAEEQCKDSGGSGMPSAPALHGSVSAPARASSVRCCEQIPHLLVSQVNPTQLLLATCAPEEKVRLWSPTADMPVEPEAAMRAYRAAANADEEEEQAVPGNILGVLTRMTERFLGTIFRGQMGGAADMDPSNMMARFRG